MRSGAHYGIIRAFAGIEESKSMIIIVYLLGMWAIVILISAMTRSAVPGTLFGILGSGILYVLMVRGIIPIQW